MLGGGLTSKDGSELSGYMTTTTCQKFFKDFTALFAKNFQSTYLSMLKGDDLKGAMQIYGMLGLPGCVGSINTTFVPCDGLSVNVKNLILGDKGAGLLFNVIVDHSRRVLFVQDPVYATINDKTSVRYNDAITMLSEHDETYPNIQYKIFTGDGENDFIL